MIGGESEDETRRRVIHYAAAPVPGGLLGHVKLLARRTSAFGFDSEVWLRPGSSLDEIAAEMEEAGVATRRITVRGKGDLAGLAGFSRAMRRSGAQVLHVHLASPVESLPVLLGASLGGARIVATEHAPTHHPTERPWSRAAKRRSVSRISGVIALTGVDARYLEERFGIAPAKIRIIPNGVETRRSLPAREEARRALGIPSEGPVLGYVGEISERKGLGDLVRAVEILASRPSGSGRAGEARGLAVILAGEGEYRPRLEEEIRQAGLAGSFFLPGEVRPPDPVHAACDLFVLPSWGEAMPLALLEAMAAGKPVVATRVGGIPETLSDGVEGRLTPPRDPEALAAAIDALLRGPESRRRMGGAARDRVESAFSAEKMAADTCALYEEILREED